MDERRHSVVTKAHFNIGLISSVLTLVLTGFALTDRVTRPVAREEADKVVSERILAVDRATERVERESKERDEQYRRERVDQLALIHEQLQHLQEGQEKVLQELGRLGAHQRPRGGE